MVGRAPPGSPEIAIRRVDGLPWQAPGSSLVPSSTTAKSAASASSVICTRTVACAGSSVKAIWMPAVQNKEVSSTELSPMAMQGCETDPTSLRANTAVANRGTTEARILKRNMTSYSPGPHETHLRRLEPYGLQSVKETRYRQVDARSPLSRLPHIIRECPVRQRLGQMQPANLVRTVEV